MCCGYLVFFSEMLFLHMNDTDVFGVFTAARDWPEPERPNTASRERIGLYCVLGLTAAAISVLAVYSFTLCLLNKIYTRSSGGFQKTDSLADGSEETV